MCVVVCMQPRRVVPRARAQLGQHHAAVPTARLPRLCPPGAGLSTGARNHAKVICNQLSISKGNSSIRGLVQWAGSMGQLLRTGTGTCLPAAPRCPAFIQCVVLATMSNQMLVKYNVHGKWGRLNPRLNILSCHLWFFSFFCWTCPLWFVFFPPSTVQSDVDRLVLVRLWAGHCRSFRWDEESKT